MNTKLKTSLTGCLVTSEQALPILGLEPAFPPKIFRPDCIFVC